MLRECAICGKEDNERFMWPYNIGSRTQWLCWECHKAAQREATASDGFRGKKLHKIAEGKKRRKY